MNLHKSPIHNGCNHGSYGKVYMVRVDRVIWLKVESLACSIVKGDNGPMT